MPRSRSYHYPFVEEMHAIDLANLRRWGMLKQSGNGTTAAVTWRDGLKIDVIASPTGVRFIRREGSELLSASVPFVHSPTQFNGRRAWFQCPACRRGCRVLYVRGFGLRCRRCLGLRYLAQYEARPMRLIERARKLRQRLGQANYNSGEPLPPKPRRMRWARYRSLERRVMTLELAGWSAMREQLSSMRRRSAA